MTNTKHTPAPWEAATEDGKLGVIGATSKGKFIAIVGITGEQGMDAERKANARLIAAAPELLEALEYFCHAVTKPQNKHGMNMVSKAHEKAVGIIAKARGQL